MLPWCSDHSDTTTESIQPMAALPLIDPGEAGQPVQWLGTEGVHRDLPFSAWMSSFFGFVPASRKQKTHNPKGENRNAKKWRRVNDSLVEEKLKEDGFTDAKIELASEDIFSLSSKDRAAVRSACEHVPELLSLCPVESEAQKRERIAAVDAAWSEEYNVEEKGEELLLRVCEDDMDAVVRRHAERSALDILMQELDLGGDSRLVVNGWMQETHKRRDFHFRDAGNGVVEISGNFSFVRNNNPRPYVYSTTTRLDVHRGEEVLAQSSCGALLVVRGPALAPFDTIGRGVVYASNMDRLYALAKGILPNLDYSKATGMVQKRSLLVQRYKSFFPDYGALEADALAVLTSERMRNLEAGYWLRARAMYETNLESRILAAAAKRGFDADTAILNAVRAHLYHFHTSIFGYQFEWKKRGSYASVWDRILALAAKIGMSSATTMACLGLLSVPGAIAMFSCAVGISLGLYMFAERNPPPSKLEALQKVANIYEDFGSPAAMVPCARIALKKVTTNPRRLNKVADPRISIINRGTLLEPEDIEAKEVDCYGTTMPVPMVYMDSNDQNLVAAAEMRYGFEHPPIDPAYFEKYSAFVHRFYDDLAFPDLSTVTPEQNFEHLVATYGRARGESLFELSKTPLTDKDMEMVGMVKGEIYLNKTKDDMKSRAITACCEKIIAHFSVYWHLISKWLASVLSADSGKCYGAGLSPSQVGQFGEGTLASHKYLVASDYTNYDGSRSDLDLALELEFHKRLIGMPVEYDIVLNNYLRVVSWSRSRAVKIVRTFGRNSGDLWTSSLNSLFNVLEFCFVNGKDTVFDNDLDLLVCGDDGVAGVDEEPDAAELVNNYARLGKIVKIDVHDSIEDACFCSGRFWRVGGSLIWGLLPFRMMAKLGYNHGNFPKHQWKSLLYGTAQSMRTNAFHVPVFGSLLRAIISTAKQAGLRALEDWRDRNPTKIKGGTTYYPEEDTYEQFARIYNVDVDTIKRLETWIERTVDIAHFPYLLSDDLWINGFAADMDAYVDYDFDGHIISFDEHYYYTQFVPAMEERYKLDGAQTFDEALTRAVLFGADEDDELGTRSHTFLHSAFTALSWVNFEWGVGLHSAYNNLALQAATGIVPCARRKKKKGKQPPPTNKTKDNERSLKKVVKAAVKEILVSGGAAVGGALGGMPGAALGGSLGAAASGWLGSGSYTRMGNELIVGRSTRVGKPEKPLILTRHEYVGDLVSASDFSIATFQVNPGLVELFGWGSQVANQYTQWRPQKLLFHYKSTSADWSGSGVSLPTVMMRFQYDVLADPSISKREIVDSFGGISCKSASDIDFGVECKQNLTANDLYYVRDNTLESTHDLRDYDLGFLEVGVVGGDAAIDGEIIGELYVTYQIELHKPDTTVNPYVGLLKSRVAEAVSVTVPGGTTVLSEFGTLPVVITSLSNYIQVLFPDPVIKGIYQITVIQKQVAGATAGATGAVLNGCSYVARMTDAVGALTNSVSVGVGTNSTGPSFTTYVELDGTGVDDPYYRVSWSTVPTSNAGVCQVTVCAVRE